MPSPKPSLCTTPKLPVWTAPSAAAGSARQPSRDTSATARRIPSSSAASRPRCSPRAYDWPVDDLIERALAEDVGPGDLTAAAVVPEDAAAAARIEQRAP